VRFLQKSRIFVKTDPANCSNTIIIIGLPQLVIVKECFFVMNQLYCDIRNYIKENLSKERQKHSIEVSKLAKLLCKMYDIDSEKGLLVGIAHDIAREFQKNKLEIYAKKDGKPLSPWEKKNPVLLHGRAGAEYLKERWNIADAGILDAIRYHTCGRPGMSLLGKILFVADYLEPGRRFLEEKERQKILKTGIDRMVLYVFNKKFLYEKKKGRKILKPSLLLYQELVDKTEGK